MASQLRSLPQSVRRVLLPLLMAISLLATSMAGIAWAGTTPPWNVSDGIPLPGAPTYQDDCGGNGDDQSKNGTGYKLNDIDDSDAPVFWESSMTPKSDICDVWLLTQTDADGDVWLYFAWTRANNTGSQLVYLELLNDITCSTVTSFACNPFDNRDAGSRVLVYDFQGSNSNIDVLRRTWLPAGGDGSGMFGPEGPIGSNVDGKTSTDGYFGEAAINLTDEGVLPNVNDPTAGCTIIAAAIPYTVTGNADPDETNDKEDTAEMKDVVLFDIPPISNCGSAAIIKRDAPATDENSSVLTGAKYNLYRDDGDQVFEPGAGDTLIGDCETGSSDPCSFTELPGGWYWAQETDAPAWYVDPQSPTDVQLKQVTPGNSATFTFVNAPIPFRISVTPDTDTNPVDQTHRFEVKLEQNPSGDGTTWVALPNVPYAADENDPQPHEFVVDWSFASDSGSATETVDLDPEPDATVQGCAEGTGTDGICYVDVSVDAPSNGTLTATYYTPYQHTTTPNPVTSNTLDATIPDPENEGETLPVLAPDQIADNGAKAWRGLDITITPPDAENLVGDSHTFTVTVYELDGTETSVTEGALEGGATVNWTWTDPSSVQQDSGSCLTEADDTDPDFGTCDVTFTETTPGDWTFAVTSVTGTISGISDQQLTVTYSGDNTRTANKTWVDFRVTVSPLDDTNDVDWLHVFDVTVERNDGNGWAAFDADAVAATWVGPGGLTSASTCANGTGDAGDSEALGACSYTVDPSGTTGTGTLTIDTIDVWVDDDADSVRDAGEVQTVAAGTSGVLNHTDPVATKTWVDYGALLSGDFTNPLGTSHTFTVEVFRIPTGDLSDATVTLEWRGPVGSTVETATDGPETVTDSSVGVQVDCEPTYDAGDEKWTCAVTVDSDTNVGTGTLSVISLTDEGVVDGETSASATFEFGNESTTATKTWKIYRVVMSDDAINLTGESHDFLVRAEYADSLDGGEPDWQPYSGATLSFGWTGPGDPSPNPCVTADGVSFGGSTYDGACVVTVSSDEVATGVLSVTSFVVDDEDPIDLGQDREATLESSDTAQKTWIEVNVDIDEPAVNLVGDPHPFGVTATISHPGGTTDVPTGTPNSLSFTTGGDLSGLATTSVVDDCSPFEVSGECTITVTSTETGTLTITLTEITFVYEGETFTVTLTGNNVGQGTIDNDTSKQWISYELSMSPQDATNLLPLDPEHLITVTLDSSDEDGAAPVGGQTLDLTLTSDNGATIVEINGDDTPDINTSFDEESGLTTVTAQCVTSTEAATLGQCAVWISTDTPGHASLNASYDIYIGETLVDTIDTSEYSSDLEGDTNGQDADKTWTSYLVDVSGPAINLVDSDHTFVVTVRQTFDGVNYDYIEGAVFGQEEVEDGSYILITDNDGGTSATIDGGTCFTTGTDELGQCTVEVSTTETTIATVTAYYLGTASDSDSDFFFDENTKQWIDYMLDIDPDTADNLVDNPHVFTVSVAVDLGEGDGWQALPEGEMAEVALSGVGTISSTGDGGTVAEDGLSGTCVLVPNGGGTASTCQVTIDSAVAGLSELTASYEGVAADGDLVNLEEKATYIDEEGPAEKNWVDYFLELNEDAVNPIGTTHTFTATLWKATTSNEQGSIFVIAPNEELVFSITGVGTVIDVIDGTVDEDGLGGVCTTDANGQCDIVIQSDEVGQTTVTAEYFAEVGETTGTFDDEAVKTWVSNPAISLVKTGSTTEAELGELVTYTYLITNTGDVRLDFVTLDDEIEVSGLFADLLNLLLPSAELSLEPGESVEFTSTYLVTSDDFPGPIDNVAETTGTAPDGTVVRDDDDWSVTVIGDPAIELIKEANIVPDASGIKNVTVDPANPGATTIEYTYTVTNVGNVPLSNLTLTDYVLSEIPDNPIGDYSYDEALAAFDGTLITVDLPVDSLAPGATTVGVATFSVRDIDVANALINNVAEVNGTDAAGTTVSDDDPETVFVTAVLGVVIEKPPLPATGISAFELLMYGLLAGGLGLVLVYVLPSAPVAARRRDED